MRKLCPSALFSTCGWQRLVTLGMALNTRKGVLVGICAAVALAGCDKCGDAVKFNLPNGSKVCYQTEEKS